MTSLSEKRRPLANIFLERLNNGYYILYASYFIAKHNVNIVTVNELTELLKQQ